MSVRLPVRVIGRGRAGGALAEALRRVDRPCGLLAGHGVDPGVCRGAEVVVLAVPDSAIATVAASITPDPRCAVLHLSGVLGLDVLVTHERRGSMHPLVSLADADSGADRLREAWFAVNGDPATSELVAALGGRSFVVSEEHRAVYHATAVVASNHLVALLGQVERLSARVGAPPGAFAHLIESTLSNVAALGAAAALTGPVSRGDWETVRLHLDAVGSDERPFYRAAAIEAARLVGRSVPNDISADDSPNGAGA